MSENSTKAAADSAASAASDAAKAAADAGAKAGATKPPVYAAFARMIGMFRIHHYARVRDGMGLEANPQQACPIFDSNSHPATGPSSSQSSALGPLHTHTIAAKRNE
jgi:hypothetical protein